MKQSEIAPRVFELLERTPPTKLRGGPLSVPPTDLVGLSLVPWFCEACVQWAIRVAIPGQPFRKSPFRKVKGAHAAVTPDGVLQIGVSGEGMDPSIWALSPLAEAIADIAVPGMILELGAANLGVVKCDWEVKADTQTTDGDHHYYGVIDDEGLWRIERTAPALERRELETALACGRMAIQKGPWTTTSKEEAVAIAVDWFVSPAANLNPLAALYFFKFHEGAFVNSDPQMDNKLPGLALGFFRQRLAGGSFHWTTGRLQGIHTLEQLQQFARDLVG